MGNTANFEGAVLYASQSMLAICRGSEDEKTLSVELVEPRPRHDVGLVMRLRNAVITDRVQDNG